MLTLRRNRSRVGRNQRAGASVTSIAPLCLVALCLAAGSAEAQLPPEERLPDGTEPLIEARLLDEADAPVDAENTADFEIGSEEIDVLTESEAHRYHLYLRPFAGVGWTDSFGDSRTGLGLHAGGRILFSAPLSSKIGAKFGVEATYLELDIRDENTIPERYVLVGFVLEMTLFQNFLMTTGTVGYVGLGDTEGNHFGIVTDVGWEPTWDSRAVPYVTLRSEFVFDDNVYSVLSLSVGFSIGLI